jgi:hypothetical protein
MLGVDIDAFPPEWVALANKFLRRPTSLLDARIIEPAPDLSAEGV